MAAFQQDDILHAKTADERHTPLKSHLRLLVRRLIVRLLFYLNSIEHLSCFATFPFYIKLATDDSRASILASILRFASHRQHTSLE